MKHKTEIVVFGCSHSKWLPFLTWADILEINGTSIINYAKPGCGNLQILMQLIKHYELYGFENKKIIVQPTYSSRIFDHYTSKIYFLNNKFDVNFSVLKNNHITEFIPDINIDNFLEDYHHAMMTSIHNFLIQNSLDFNYIQIEKYGDNYKYNKLLASHEPYVIQGIDIKKIIKFSDLYKNIKYPNPNHGHMNALQHLDVAKKVVEHLNLPDITEKTTNIINNVHDYFCTTETVDLKLLERMKNDT